LRIFPVLAHEIALAKPDVVVFFSGSNFDELLCRTFSGAKIVPFQQHEDLISNVRHPSLPERTFRTLHPTTLQIEKQASRVLRVIAGRA